MMCHYPAATVLKKLFILLLSLSFCLETFSQDSLTKPVVTTPSSRKWIVAGAHAAIWTGTFIALNKAWYADYEKEDFHTFNDWPEWNQMDKAGHVWTTYQLSRASAASWKWAGFNSSQSVWLGSISGLAFQSIIEIQDGYSAEWGFSWSDMAANVVGASLFAAQELGWKDQRLQVKMSYWPYDYPDDLVARRDELFGESGIERILKDYNSQTYWLSANPRSFFKNGNFPKWLNIAVGYSSDLMLAGRENIWEDGDGNTIDRSDIPRIRRFYISPDLDLTKIKTRSKFLRSVFFVLNAIKIPAPTLEYNSQGKFKLHAVYF